MALDRVFRDERGFTTVAMALSILITLGLVFTSAQVYRINSASAEVQEVADAAVLSAENQVGEFMVIVQFCDAVVLSLTLTSLTVTGLGLAALCVPATAPLSKDLLAKARGIIDARNTFSTRAGMALNTLQGALPFFSAACAEAVAHGNNGTSSGANYIAAAVLVPAKGEKIEIPYYAEIIDLMGDIAGKSDAIQEDAAEAEQASREANEAKMRAFQSDCGDNPGQCMYERAAHLAGMRGTDNPLFNSVDTWSFSVALQRSKAYYRYRLDHESPEGSSVAEQARSALRRNFYRYATEQMQKAYVHETKDEFEAYFPHLPRNTQEMRGSSLYQQAIYPITSVEGSAEGGEGEEGGDGGHRVMHAWSGCPEATGATGTGSIAQMESGGFETCPACEFKAASLGKVAAASSSVPSGFEYHYAKVAQEAANYQAALQRAEGPKNNVKLSLGPMMQRLADLISLTAQRRLEPTPPGRYGAIAFVVNTGTTSSAGGFGEAFTGFDGQLGPRAALSAATLIKDSRAENEGHTVLNSMLDGLRQDGGVAVGAAGLVLDAWSFLLKVYGDGQRALVDGIRNTLNAIPLASASGLGTWAADRLNELFNSLGLQPAELKVRKAVLVNSGLVAARSDDGFAKGFVEVKQRLVAGSSDATDLFSLVLDGAEAEALSRVEDLGDNIQIASIELFGSDGPSIPIIIPLPEPVKSFGVGVIQDIFARLRSFRGEESQIRIWE